MDVNLVLAGEAGQGLKTFSHIMAKGLFRAGFEVFASKDYMSRVRGGHNFMQIRFGDESFSAPVEQIDILIALNREGLEEHAQRVKDDGVILFDGDFGKELKSSAKKLIELPASDIAAEVNPRAENTVFMGAVLKILSLSPEPWHDLLAERFDSEQIVDDNQLLLRRGGEEVEGEFSLTPPDSKGNEIFAGGNEALAFGAAVSGVKFYSAYPMTPSTDIMNYLASHQDELGLAMEQAEDELGAINMAIGASHAGIRAMTGTSGGGFALMNEGLGLAGVTEIPLVIAEVQRPGPATGLPTRTSQADLLFVINSSQGEFPLKVIAPRTQEEAFYQTVRAFNLAEKYQIPVILLSDQFLADSSTNFPEFDLGSIQLERYLIDEGSLPEGEDYRRYKFTDEGVSPRAYPGQFEDEVVLVDSHEHDEYGFVTEDQEICQRIIEKRNKKRERMREEDLLAPEFSGAENPDYLVVTWGSSHGPVREAVSHFVDEDVKMGLLSYTDVWPLERETLKNLAGTADRLISVENNSTAQFARLITSETGVVFEDNILKADGRPFHTGEIIAELQEIVN